MVSSIGPAPNAIGGAGTRGNKIAALARLQMQLSACEEQLQAVERQDPALPTKQREQSALSAKIAAIKTQIAELSRYDTSPAEREAEAREEAKSPRAESPDQSPLDTVRLALVKEGHLGTLVNLRA